MLQVDLAEERQLSWNQSPESPDDRFQLAISYG